MCAFGALGSAPKDVDGSEARPRFVELGGRGRVDVCRDGDGCVSMAEDDSTGMTAFGFVSGGCRGSVQPLRAGGQVPEADFLLSSSVFFLQVSNFQLLKGMAISTFEIGVSLSFCSNLVA